MLYCLVLSLCCCLFLVIVVLYSSFYVFFFFKQKTAYEMRISDWSSDVCSSDLIGAAVTVDGRYVGRSPVSVNDLTAGPHTVVMKHDTGTEIGRASCRERVCQYV